jgi:hypothetical protein
VNDTLDILCLFLTSGRTFTFRYVTILSDNEYEIRFAYNAMSDGLEKEATFYKAHVAGVAKTASTSDTPEEETR